MEDTCYYMDYVHVCFNICISLSIEFIIRSGVPSFQTKILFSHKYSLSPWLRQMSRAFPMGEDLYLYKGESTQ